MNFYNCRNNDRNNLLDWKKNFRRELKRSSNFLRFIFRVIICKIKILSEKDRILKINLFNHLKQT